MLTSCPGLGWATTLSVCSGASVCPCEMFCGCCCGGAGAGAGGVFCVLLHLSYQPLPLPAPLPPPLSNPPPLGGGGGAHPGGIFGSWYNVPSALSHLFSPVNGHWWPVCRTLHLGLSAPLHIGRCL